MKLNYKYLIILLYVGFVSIMGVLVYKCAMLKTDVINKDYYAEELVYQQQIERQQRTKDLATQPSWNLSGEDVVLTFPQLKEDQVINGKVEFFCPSDEAKDKSFTIAVNDNNTFTIPKSTLSPGRYTLKLFWAIGAVEYYSEGIVRIDA